MHDSDLVGERLRKSSGCAGRAAAGRVAWPFAAVATGLPPTRCQASGIFWRLVLWLPPQNHRVIGVLLSAVFPGALKASSVQSQSRRHVDPVDDARGSSETCVAKPVEARVSICDVLYPERHFSKKETRLLNIDFGNPRVEVFHFGFLRPLGRR